MIVVVADTSPLNYLIQIDCDRVLPALYERVLAPGAVVEELRHPRAAAAVRAWLTRMPSWLAVEEVDESADARLASLDPGERRQSSWRRKGTRIWCSWMKGLAFESPAHKR